MPDDLPLRCECGAFRGRAHGVSQRTGNRVVCYCDDCQCFPHYLGCADRVLDPRGGTDIFQTSPARLEFQQGAEHLACIRLTSKGMLRWYASCCRTPIGNTMPLRKMPFVGVIHSCMDHRADGRSRDDALGAIRGRVGGRFAKGDAGEASEDVHEGLRPTLLLRMVPMVAMSALRREHKRSPFFDAATGRPSATPHVLTSDEMQRVVAARDAL